MKKVFLAILATAAMAMAESHTHDGFFLNLALGFGYQGFTYDANKSPYDMEAKGVSTELDIKLGGRIATNTLLHATILGVTNTSEIEFKTKGGSKVGSSSDKSENLSMLGVGLTYYLPENIFISGSVGFANFNLQDNTDEDNDIEGTTEKGLGVQVAAGKEWWVSDNWGIGVSAAFTYGSAEDQKDLGDASAYGVNVMFSATFN
jgi:opacity protein-like surface antigen